MTDATAATTAQPGCSHYNSGGCREPSYGDFVGGRAASITATAAAVSAAAGPAIRGGGNFGSSTLSAQWHRRHLHQLQPHALQQHIQRPACFSATNQRCAAATAAYASAAAPPALHQRCGQHCNISDGLQTAPMQNRPVAHLGVSISVSCSSWGEIELQRQPLSHQHERWRRSRSHCEPQ